MAGYCAACGSALEPGSVFCAVCGSKVGGVDIGPPAGTPPLAQAYQPAAGTDGHSFAVAASAGSGPTRQVQIAVPRWLAKDWAGPAVLGLCAPLVGTVLLYLAFSLLIIAAGVEGASSLGSLFGVAPTVWARYNGLPANALMVATGLAWILVSFKISGKIASRIRRSDEVSLPGRTYGAAVKTSILYAISTLLIGVVGHAILGRSSTSGQGSVLGGALASNLAATFFVGLLVGFVLSLRWLLRASSTTLASAAGLNLDIDLPAALVQTTKAAWSGAKLALGVGIGAAAALTYIGLLVAALSNGGLIGGVARSNWFSVVALVETAAAATWADVGAGMLVHLMRFLLGAPLRLPLDVGFRTPGWLYVGLLVPAVGCVLGGVRSARRRAAQDVTTAMISGAAIGPFLALPLFVWAVFNSNIVGGGMVVAALLLPMLWGALFGAAGAFYVATRDGLPGGGSFRVVVSTASAAPAPVPLQQGAPVVPGLLFCPQCGAGWRAGNRFCHECGSPPEAPAPAYEVPPANGAAAATPPPVPTYPVASPPRPEPEHTGAVESPAAGVNDTGATLMVTRCPSCKRIAADDDSFCASCGHAISGG